MGLFEEQPWLLLPFVLVVVVAYDLVKLAVRRMLERDGQAEGRSR
jgi:hypothetical protein